MTSTQQLWKKRDNDLLGILVEVEDMTRYIVDYLNAQDIRSLFNTSMRLASMKKKFVYWSLKKDQSLRYQADSSIRFPSFPTH